MVAAVGEGEWIFLFPLTIFDEDAVVVVRCQQRFDVALAGVSAAACVALLSSEPLVAGNRRPVFDIARLHPSVD